MTEYEKLQLNKPLRFRGIYPRLETIKEPVVDEKQFYKDNLIDEDIEQLEKSFPLLQSVFKLGFENIAPFIEDYEIFGREFLLMGVLDSINFVQDHRNITRIGVDVTEEVVSVLVDELFSFSFVEEIVCDSLKWNVSDLGEYSSLIREKVYLLLKHNETNLSEDKKTLLKNLEQNLGYSPFMTENLRRSILPGYPYANRVLMGSGLTPIEAFSSPPLLTSLVLYNKILESDRSGDDKILLGSILNAIASLTPVVNESHLFIDSVIDCLNIEESNISSDFINIELTLEEIEYLLNEITTWSMFKDLINPVGIQFEIDLDDSYADQLDLLDEIAVSDILIDVNRYFLGAYHKLLMAWRIR